MIFQLILFLLLLIVLFFLSQKIQTSIFNNVFIVTKNRNIAIGVLIILLLPGTIIHELSHFIIATILRVPTGELTVLPTVEKDGTVKAGKLFLGDTDPFRLSIIGLAPILIGLLLIYIAGQYFIPAFSQPLTTNRQLTTLSLFVICYLLFAISLTMFSSRKDVESLILSGPIVLILFVSLYIVGVRIFLNISLTAKLGKFLSDLNYYLIITVILNLLVFTFLTGSLYFWQKILKRKINP